MKPRGRLLFPNGSTSHYVPAISSGHLMVSCRFSAKKIIINWYSGPLSHRFELFSTIRYDDANWLAYFQFFRGSPSCEVVNMQHFCLILSHKSLYDRYNSIYTHVTSRYDLHIHIYLYVDIANRSILIHIYIYMHIWIYEYGYSIPAVQNDDIPTLCSHPPKASPKASGALRLSPKDQEETAAAHSSSGRRFGAAVVRKEVDITPW